jgi:hypothetical protein
LSGQPAENAAITVKTKGGDNVVSLDVEIALVEGGLRNVAYVTDATNDNYKSDKILSHLKGLEGWYVREFDAQSSKFDYSLFDLIVISEVTPSTAPIVAELEGIDKPVLTLKVHAYKNASGAWNWAADGYGDNTTETNLVVAEKYLSHPMFKDVNFVNGNEVNMVSEVNTKALTFMNPESFTEAEGTIEPIANIKGEEAVSILEIAAGAVVAGTSIPQNYIQIGLNSSSYANITKDGLSVVENACLYLLGELKPEQGGEGTDILLTNAESATLNIYPNPVEELLYIQNIGDEKVVELQIFSIDGAMVASFNISLNEGVNSLTRSELNISSGSYVVKIVDENGSDLLNKFMIVR